MDSTRQKVSVSSDGAVAKAKLRDLTRQSHDAVSLAHHGDEARPPPRPLRVSAGTPEGLPGWPCNSGHQRAGPAQGRGCSDSFSAIQLAWHGVP